jgi:hypothetical protein
METKADCRTIFDLDSTELALLEYYANNSTGKAGSMARGILEYASNGHFCHCPGSQPTWFKQSKPHSKTFVDRGIKVTVKPNPAKDWVAFNYTLPDDKTVGTIKIVDPNGAFVTSFKVTGTQGQKVWDTRKVNSGVYFYTLSVGEFTRSGKIVISK